MVIGEILAKVSAAPDGAMFSESGPKFLRCVDLLTGKIEISQNEDFEFKSANFVMKVIDITDSRKRRDTSQTKFCYTPNLSSKYVEFNFILFFDFK